MDRAHGCARRALKRARRCADRVITVASDLALPAARVDDAVLRASLDAIVSIDARGVVLEFNPAAERMFGYSARGRRSAPTWRSSSSRPRTARRTGAACARLLDGGDGRLLEQRLELEAQRADGSLFPVELAITRLAGGGRDRDLHRLRPRPDRRQARRARAPRADRAPGARRRARPDRADAASRRRTSSPTRWRRSSRGSPSTAASRSRSSADGGMRREAAIGLGPLAGHGEPAGEAQAQLLHRTIAANGSLLLRGVELADLARDGTAVRPGHARGALRDAAGRPRRGHRPARDRGRRPDALGAEDIGFAQAIANVVGTAVARWRADEEITRLGLHDPLTGLANRPLFEDRLEQALERSRRGQGETGLLFVDLDGFSKLNDGFGHRTGDEVLVGAGARLRGALPADGDRRAPGRRRLRRARARRRLRRRAARAGAQDRRSRCASRCSPAGAS